MSGGATNVASCSEGEQKTTLVANAGRLAGRIALVTGAAGGLGRATVRALARAGATVVAADVDEAGAQAIAAEVGGHALACDVSDLDANRAAVAFAVETCGGLDLVHLNAGVGSGCGVDGDFDLALYRRAIGVNLDGVVFGLHAALPALRARGGGAIVATSSLAGLTGVAYDPLYSASKHAVVGLTRSLGPPLAEEGIRLNAVCPGFAESAIIEPIRDMIAASGVAIIPAATVANAVVELFAGDAAGECVVIQPGRDPLPFAFRGVPGPR
jgi:NAD(P)-dependent dehydrogenase (short-subunit alcohol dehydrogenase family)